MNTLPTDDNFIDQNTATFEPTPVEPNTIPQVDPLTEPLPLERVLDEIADDSQSRTQEYLNDSVATEGE